MYPLEDLLWHALKTGTVVTELPDALRLDSLEDAERVQDHLLQRLGLGIGAWKLGATNRPARELLKLDRQFMGAVPVGQVVSSPARIPAAALRHTVIEGEISFRFGRDLPPRPGGYGADEVREAVATVHPSFEIPATRFPGLGHFGGCALVADNGAAGWLVVGDGVPLRTAADWEALDLDDCAVRVTVDGETVATGSGAAILGTPFGTLVEHVRQASERGIALRAGQYVATGNCAGLSALTPGCTVVAGFAGLGEVVLTLDAGWTPADRPSISISSGFQG